MEDKRDQYEIHRVLCNRRHITVSEAHSLTGIPQDEITTILDGLVQEELIAKEESPHASTKYTVSYTQLRPLFSRFANLGRELILAKRGNASL